jgi:insulysin
MEVILISDPDSEKAAAAMDMRVGAFSDPDDVPGLAHFLEHMLFYSRCERMKSRHKQILYGTWEDLKYSDTYLQQC